MQNAAMVLLKCWRYKDSFWHSPFFKMIAASALLLSLAQNVLFIFLLLFWSYSHHHQHLKSVAHREAFLHSALLVCTAELRVTSHSKKKFPHLTPAVHPTQFAEQGHLSVRQETPVWGYAPAQPPTCQSTVGSQRLCTNKLIELTLKSTAGPQLGNYKSRVISGT